MPGGYGPGPWSSSGDTYTTPSYSSGNGGSTDTSGNGGSTDSTINNQTGETGGHKLLDQYNELVAKGMGDTTQAQELERYLSGVETKLQSKGESLFGPVNPNEATMIAGQNPFTNLTESEKVHKLASMEAGDPFDPENKYFKSFAGQEFHDYWLDPEKGGLTKDDPILKEKWISEFGMPSIVSTQGWGTPTKTTERTDEFGHELGGEYIYSGLGKSLMDQFEGSVAGTQLFGGDIEAYQQSKDAYWDDRAVQEERDRTLPGTYGGYGGGGGSGGGGGYYGDPRTGNPIDRYGNFYTPQANLQQAMVNVHGTPTVFRKRGGIVSLLRLN